MGKIGTEDEKGYALEKHWREFFFKFKSGKLK